MRKAFADALLKEARVNKDIWVIALDLGMGVWDEFRDEFPERYLNPGASEQAGLDIAIGLALSSKIPFVYSITPFLIYRPFEALRTYINHENIPVHLVGSGRDKDYAHDGFSHDASDIESFLNLLPNIKQYYPDSERYLDYIIQQVIKSNNPSFISLKR